MAIDMGPVGPKEECEIAIVFSYAQPGEVSNQRPLVGQSGDMFDQLLRSAEIQRTFCYLTYLIKRPVYEKDDKKIMTYNYKQQVKVTDEFVAYQKQLKEELYDCSANIIIAVGDMALYALTEYVQVTKRCGSIYPSTFSNSRGEFFKVIGCIDRAPAMAKYIYRYYILHDLQRAKLNSEFPDIRLPQYTYYLDPSYREAYGYLENIKKNYKRVAYDIEVKNYEVSCISFAPTGKEAMSINFLKAGTNHYSEEEEFNLWLLIAEILEDKELRKIGQNLTFDNTFLKNIYGIDVVNLDDTMVAVGILYPDFPKGLDFITYYFTERNYYKDEGKFHMKGFREDETSFWKYNADDAMVCMETIDEMYEELEENGMLESYKRQVSLIPILSYMSIRGINMDIDKMKKRASWLENRINLWIQALDKHTRPVREKGLTEEQKEALTPLNPSSPKQLKEYFYVQLGLPAYRSRSSGSLTTDETAMKRIARKGYRAAKIILKIRKLKKEKGTYMEMTLDKDNRMRCSYNPVGTKQGRLSSSQTIYGTGGNLQNQPPIMKHIMKADDGYVCYNIDMSQAENRCVAQFANESKMIEAFDNRVDLHKLTATFIYDVPIDKVTKTQRFWGKKANHGLNYGWGYKSFALKNEIGEAEAKNIVNRYHMAYPGIERWHEQIKHELNYNNSTLINPFGRVRIFKDRPGYEMWKEAYSFPAQSTIADKVNWHGLLFLFWNDEKYREVEMLNQVHDSIVFQISKSVKPERHIEILMALKESLEQPIHWKGKDFIVPTDCNVGYDLSTPVELWVGTPKPDDLAWDDSDVAHKVTGVLTSKIDW